MKPKEVVDEREKFSRILKGVPEDEYPNDFLDDLILSMIRQQFPRASMESKLMLFSSELRDIQQLSKCIRLDAEMFVEPNLADIPNIALQLFNGIDFIHFKSAFKYMSLRKTEPLDGWLNTYNEYTKVLKTLHSPTEFFI